MDLLKSRMERLAIMSPGDEMHAKKYSQTMLMAPNASIFQSAPVASTSKYSQPWE